ncbi:MAG: glycosyltransferase family 2 protein [Flavobacteriia bacterium]|nr:MAG: glycosyltransferase family 2 protein [Flavobacteriia bacterium]
MLSILIPTYNYSVLPLVRSLYIQLKKEGKLFEIICFDNSPKSDNNSDNIEINLIENCTYELLNGNGGRSRTRNLLAQKAKYDWLLFLDADVLPVTNDFISNYYDFINRDGSKVAFGGLKYQKKPSKEKLLRWVYGKYREEIPLNERKKDPQQHFTSANFIIKKSLFERFRFDESLINYGYEDTLLALELTKKNIQISQIDNPVYHLGIDKSDLFLKKTKESVKNLYMLNKQDKIEIKDSQLLKTFGKIQKFKMNAVFRIIFKNFSRHMEKNLLSEKPSLFIFDLYKLGYLCSLYEVEHI